MRFQPFDFPARGLPGWPRFACSDVFMFNFCCMLEFQCERVPAMRCYCQWAWRRASVVPPIRNLIGMDFARFDPGNARGHGAGCPRREASLFTRSRKIHPHPF